MSDAALGNTTRNSASIGHLGSGSNFDVNGFTTSWGTLTDVRRTLKVLNSNKTTASAGKGGFRSTW